MRASLPRAPSGANRVFKIEERGRLENATVEEGLGRTYGVRGRPLREN